MRFPTWLALSSDGRVAAVAGGDYADATGSAGATGSIQFIDLTAGEPSSATRSWEGAIRAQLAFSPDGTQLLATSSGGITALWMCPQPRPSHGSRSPVSRA